MNTPKVSIILPVYNVAEFLPACLDSLLDQTLDQLEIVAVNDGSTDTSAAILQAYQEKYPSKLFVYTTTNHGVSHARNYGFSKSHGKYVWFVDSDDFIQPSACEQLYTKAVQDDNDLVLFSYHNIDMSSGKKTPFPMRHHNQNFSFSEKPYEMSILSPYPWIKLIQRELFEGLAFPEGIRFEDLPVAYLLAAKARNVGIIDECLYNYRKNVGFLGSLTPATADIKKAIIYLKDCMNSLGFLETYRTEIDFITIRHFFFRFWKLLTNYETEKKDLKLDLINQLFDYIDAFLPDWQNNHYVKYALPDHLFQLLYLYGSRKEMLHFVNTCDGMSPNQQKAWLKDYKAGHNNAYIFSEDRLIDQEQPAKESYLASNTRVLPEPGYIFLESMEGQDIHPLFLTLLSGSFAKGTRVFLSLTAKARPVWQRLIQSYQLDTSCVTLISPDSEDYGIALAQCGRLITDQPLPWYFHKGTKQRHILLCTESLIPVTSANCLTSRHDLAKWQHTMFTCDLIVFPNKDILENYMEHTMIAGICHTDTYFSTDNAALSTYLLKELWTPVDPSLPIFTEADIFRQSEGLAADTKLLFCCPLFAGKDRKQTFHYVRSFTDALYQLDNDLTDKQILYLAPAPGYQVDCSSFKHIRLLPIQYSITDLIRSCDVLITDYRSILMADCNSPTSVLRFLPEDDPYPLSSSLQKALQFVPACTNAPALIRQLQATLSVSDAFASDMLQAAKMPESRELSSHPGSGDLSQNDTAVPSIKEHILWFTGRKISSEQMDQLSSFISQHPDAQIWLSYNVLQDPKAEAYLNIHFPDIWYLPLRMDPARSLFWKISSFFITRLGLASIYPTGRMLRLGKQAYTRYFGPVSFDQVFIQATDNLQTIAFCAAAAPNVNCNLKAPGADVSFAKRCQTVFAHRLAGKEPGTG